MGNPERILCPCIDCHNVETLCGSIVVDYLVRRGMKLKYKQRKYYYEHGEQISSGDKNDEMVNNEAYNLYRAAHFFDQDYMKRAEFGNEDCIELAEDIHDEDFISKLENAKTLYTRTVQITTSYQPLQPYFDLKLRVDGLIRVLMSFLRHCQECSKRTMYFRLHCTM